MALRVHVRTSEVLFEVINGRISLSDMMLSTACQESIQIVTNQENRKKSQSCYFSNNLLDDLVSPVSCSETEFLHSSPKGLRKVEEATTYFSIWKFSLQGNFQVEFEVTHHVLRIQ